MSRPRMPEPSVMPVDRAAWAERLELAARLDLRKPGTRPIRCGRA